MVSVRILSLDLWILLSNLSTLTQRQRGREAESVTLHGLEFMCLYDDAQLQHQLWSTLQKSGQQMQHAHICKFIYHPPVVTPALCLSTLTTLNAQVDGVKIPEENRKKVVTSQDNNITIECKASEYFYNCLHLLLEQKPTSFLQCNRAQLLLIS